jgi:hypothetical protein
MTLMTETDDEELPVSQETIEKAIGVVHEYVAELRERAPYRPARDDHHDGPRYDADQPSTPGSSAYGSHASANDWLRRLYRHDGRTALTGVASQRNR